MLHVIRSEKIDIAFDPESLAVFVISDQVAHILEEHEQSHATLKRETTDQEVGGGESELGAISRLVLLITQTCNMRCKYCFAEPYMERRSLSKVMDVKTGVKAVETFLNLYPNKLQRIQFFGGEPLIGFRVIREVVHFTEEYCRVHELNIPRFYIVTNGTLLTQEIIDFFKEHHFLVTVSLDGPKEVNDQQRVLLSGKGTYDIVIDKIQQLKRAGIKVRIESTLTQKHIENNCSVETIYEYLQSAGADDIHVCLMAGDYGGPEFLLSEESVRSLAESYRSATLKAMDSFLTTAPVEVQYVFYILAALGENGGYRHFCDAGTKGLTADMYGNVYPCYFLMGEDLYMGNVLSDADFPGERFWKVKTLLETTTTEMLTPCRTCWARKLCSACYGDAYAQGKSLGPSTEAMCDGTRAIISSVLLKVSEFRLDPVTWEKFLASVAAIAEKDQQPVCGI